MKNMLVLSALVLASILPLPAFAASYYWSVTGTAGGRSTALHGPFATLGACQESLAKATGMNRRVDVTFTGCYAQ